jgi:sugar lactone lactonase YvrE
MDVGGFTIQSDGALLLFMAKGAVALWTREELKTIVKDIPAERDARFNDVIADPEGRVFCGTMPAPDHLGSLYRMDTDRKVARVIEEVGTSNGLGFTPDRKQMYYTDTRKREIYIFDYERSSGAISNRRVFVRVTDNAGSPDGLTVDAEGCVWSARWGGGCVVRYAPDGTEMARVEFPAQKVSSLTFGGEDCTDMYFTTAGGNDRKTNGPGAGAMFHLNLGIKGVPEFFSRIAV